jgi:hypothetical protein
MAGTQHHIAVAPTAYSMIDGSAIGRAKFGAQKKTL